MSRRARITSRRRNPPRVLLRDVNRAAAAYQSRVQAYGPREQGALNAFVTWRELVDRYEKQTGRPLYRINAARGDKAPAKARKRVASKRKPGRRTSSGRRLTVLGVNPIRHGYTVLANRAELATFKTKYHAVEYGRAFSRAHPTVRVQVRLPA